MYKIERRSSGYILTFSGILNADDFQRWYDESQKYLSTEKSSSFGVIIDMKDIQSISREANEIMVAGQKLYKDKGMKRSAIILKTSEECKHFKNIAVQSGIYITERYIDASQNSNSSELAINWVKDAIDPDK